jgi:cytochrome c556
MKAMLKTLIVLVVLVGFGVLIGAASAQFSRPEDAIKYRKSVMFVMAQHFSRLGSMVKGSKPYNQETFAKNAAIVETLVALPWEAFLAAGSDKGDTTMKSSVLKDPAEFKNDAQNFQMAIGRLVSAAKGDDVDGVKRQFGNVAKSCKACHSQFRK